MQINENRRRIIGEIYDYIYELVNISIQSQRKIIIWGFGRGGKWLRHLIQQVDGRVKIDYIIDEKLRVSYDSEPAIFRSSLLEYIESSKYMILTCIKNMNQIEEMLLNYGYQKGINLFDIQDDIGSSYFEFIQSKNNSINFDNVYKEKMEKDFGQEFHDNITFSYSCVDNVFEEIIQLDDNLSLFDYGCGKGAVMLMAHMVGIKKIGGVEISKSIYNQAVINMAELGIDCYLVNQDATECKIDDFNCYFLYNPFGGNVFRKVIHNIQDSYKSNKRKIYLVYANPFCHRTVIEDGLFKLHKQIRTDLYDPLCNIYVIEN